MKKIITLKWLQKKYLDDNTLFWFQRNYGKNTGTTPFLKTLIKETRYSLVFWLIDKLFTLEQKEKIAEYGLKLMRDE